MAEHIIHLDQHTPMWHFQPEETGCCLRATEVKPKLDRFFVQKWGKKETIPDNFWVDKSKKNEKDYFALDYKMSIRPKGKSCLSKINKFPLFFGNMDTEREKELIFYPEGVEVILFSLNSKLLEKIQVYINDFFACTNFGTRQSKGFGSFYPHVSFDAKGAGAKYKMEFIVDLEQTKENSLDYFKFLFKGIEKFYKSIRSGTVGRTSSMFFYAQSNDEPWDKQTFRYDFHIGVAKNEFEFSAKPASDYLFRDMLGLASSMEWKPYHKTIVKESNTVSRFKSPLTIKPIKSSNGYDVYFFFNEIPQEIRDAKFAIMEKGGGIVKRTMSLFPGITLESYFEYLAKRNKKICSIK